MSTRKQRMQALKEKLEKKPLYWVEIPIKHDATIAGSNPKADQYIQGIRCALHLEGVRKGRKVAIYQLTNYNHFRQCEHPGCTYRVSMVELP